MIKKIFKLIATELYLKLQMYVDDDVVYALNYKSQEAANNSKKLKLSDRVHTYLKQDTTVRIEKELIINNAINEELRIESGVMIDSTQLIEFSNRISDKKKFDASKLIIAPPSNKKGFNPNNYKFTPDSSIEFEQIEYIEVSSQSAHRLLVYGDGRCIPITTSARTSYTEYKSLFKYFGLKLNNITDSIITVKNDRDTKYDLIKNQRLSVKSLIRMKNNVYKNNY